MKQPTLDVDGAAGDSELMDGLVQQQPYAMEELYRRYNPILKSIVLRVVHDETDADDVLQETYIQVWDRAGSYSPEKGKLVGWLVTLARRRAIDRLRQRHAYRRATDRFETLCQRPLGNAEGEQVVQREANCDDLRVLLLKLVNALPPKQREVIWMAFFESRSQREIAAVTRTPLGTVKTRIELGMRKLTHALSGARDKLL